ncbi:exosome complex component RRP45 [Strongylocentrotus purpuratus]|uniref:Exosome complex component RRP45 n=1 Tax=Strongylocentrotus purpuratus TaxID=7668 RepID=A0A7M7NIL9_STRPU|nr:exosome complex component RRP45 [Strongylocentrotus purpuratus]
MTALSNLEEDFILKAIEESKRLDGRQPYDYRRTKIEFGVERGCCMVHMGDTRILAQVSCEVVEPKENRPNEGQLFVNLELSPMASTTFEAGRLSDYGIELNRLLERTVKDSRAVDVESLCIVAGEKVWKIRLDVHVLNHDGNILDSACIAALAALSHFRRPDVTVIGESVTIHSPQDRDPVPLNVHHIPVCVTFAFYHKGKRLLVDPTEKEEKVMEGTMVVGMNVHRELCTMQVTGSMLILKEQIIRCCQIGVVKVSELTELIKQALEKDKTARAEGKKFGFAESHPKKSITSKVIPEQTLDTSDVEDEVSRIMETAELPEQVSSKLEIKKPGLGQIGDGLTNSWLDDGDADEAEEEENGNSKEEDEMEGAIGSEDEDEEEEEEEEEKKMIVTKPKAKDKRKGKSKAYVSDSEEEETFTLDNADLDVIQGTKSQKLSEELDLTAALKKPSDKTKSRGNTRAKGGKKKWKKEQNIKDRP